MCTLDKDSADATIFFGVDLVKILTLLLVRDVLFDVVSVWLSKAFEVVDERDE